MAFIPPAACLCSKEVYHHVGHASWMEVRHPVCPARHAAAGARDICGSGGPAIAVFETQVHLARHVVEVVPNAARIAQPSGGDPTSVW
eukprot:CAMPEP_0178397958 /NCGR_PEP_ID=MMETSP0689_2-20121128/14526_1 /TAXON_ID=160604 /ORGANISM="Amphidinium massartii, Strain CS-259" /LENGTH=87 /DNA_ID=CAMNT_0020018707 /DNA_START=183 /DNA_END=442 /DNA_ORIENTATION=+